MPRRGGPAEATRGSCVARTGRCWRSTAGAGRANGSSSSPSPPTCTRYGRRSAHLSVRSSNAGHDSESSELGVSLTRSVLFLSIHSGHASGMRATPRHAGHATPRHAGHATPRHAGHATPRHAGHATPRHAGHATPWYAGHATPCHAGHATPCGPRHARRRCACGLRMSRCGLRIRNGGAVVRWSGERHTQTETQTETG
jgi:hypothetical protein